MLRYVSICQRSVLPPDILACYHSHTRPLLSDIMELAGKGRLRTTDDDISCSSESRHCRQQGPINTILLGELLAC